MLADVLVVMITDGVNESCGLSDGSIKSTASTVSLDEWFDYQHDNDADSVKNLKAEAMQVTVANGNRVALPQVLDQRRLTMRLVILCLSKKYVIQIFEKIISL
jgi:hypothetical protein